MEVFKLCTAKPLKIPTFISLTVAKYLMLEQIKLVNTIEFKESVIYYSKIQMCRM